MYHLPNRAISAFCWHNPMRSIHESRAADAGPSPARAAVEHELALHAHVEGVAVLLELPRIHRQLSISRLAIIA
jgi:hypothetical protein